MSPNDDPNDDPSGHSGPPYRVLVLKTAALGDVLRTTAILPGLDERARKEGRQLQVTWMTAPGAQALVSGHPLVNEAISVNLGQPESLSKVQEQLSQTTWDRVLSFDDEQPLCELATAVGGDVITGAYMDSQGNLAYSPDVAPWFDMGLISAFGKPEADRLKRANERSHPEIFSTMVGVSMGEPFFDVPASALEEAEKRLSGHHGPWIGLNTGAGGRWTSKSLPEETVLELAVTLDQEHQDRFGKRPTFILLGGPEEKTRHASLLEQLGPKVVLMDGSTDNSLLEFAALIDRLDLLVTSDSLAMHIAIARRCEIVAFFAPTSAAEIELFGRGEKVQSTAPDYCSYKPDADTSTLTAKRLREAVLRRLEIAIGG